jgi:nucleotide-binding universal stress UspA family protein
MKIEEINHMNYQHVVVPLDGSELAECVFPHLEAVASNCQITEVELVRAVTPVEMHYKAAFPIDSKQEKQINEANIREAENYLLKIKSGLDSSRMTVTTRVLTGSHIAETLADYLNKSGADLLLMATHGRSGASRWIWGSVADRLLQISCIPVFLVRPPTCVPHKYGKA